MKSKTNFKQMYLVDATAYNGINRTDTPIILGRSNKKVLPSTINVSAPVTSGVENSKTSYPIRTELKSAGTQSNVLSTKSTGVVTEPPPNKEHSDQASQTLNDRKLQTKYRSPRINNRSSRDDHRLGQPQDLQNSLENPNPQIENDTQISKKEIPLNAHLQYIVPDPEFQKAMDFTTMQHTPQPQTHSQLMDNNTIQYSAPLALPQPQQPTDYNTIQYSAPLALVQPQQPTDYNTIQYSAPLALPQPQQPMNYNTIQYSAPLALPQPQLMEYSVTPQINYLPQPQLMDHSSSTQTPSYPALPQPMDYSVNPQNSAAPVDDDCTECAVTKYKRYDVSLPSARGLPLVS